MWNQKLNFDRWTTLLKYNFTENFDNSPTKKIKLKINPNPFLFGFFFDRFCVLFSFFHHKMTENCNRFDDFTTLSHSAERTIVKADWAGFLSSLLLLLLLLRGLKISDTHMKARSRSRERGGVRAAYTVHFSKKKLTNFISHKFWANT